MSNELANVWSLLLFPYKHVCACFILLSESPECLSERFIWKNRNFIMYIMKGPQASKMTTALKRWIWVWYLISLMKCLTRPKKIPSWPVKLCQTITMRAATKMFSFVLFFFLCCHMSSLVTLHLLTKCVFLCVGSVTESAAEWVGDLGSGGGWQCIRAEEGCPHKHSSAPVK